MADQESAIRINHLPSDVARFLHFREQNYAQSEEVVARRMMLRAKLSNAGREQLINKPNAQTWTCNLIAIAAWKAKQREMETSAANYCCGGALVIYRGQFPGHTNCQVVLPRDILRRRNAM